ncbi:hypothetical protein E4K64_17090 [Bradyrhizobium frederickii]|uniref:Uncharacterized protein n=2 Tax=Bradyrhizobium frederickii TaxID=2560054 RepID=A0A4Y9P2H9_9BRAD|nr:hypothetical protein E4K64_17090 [Bradyrhizobium frederickii]
MAASAGRTGWAMWANRRRGGAVVFQAGVAEQTGSQPICGSMVMVRNFSSAATALWHTSPTMRLCRPVLAALTMALASPCFAETSSPIPVNNPPAQQNGLIDLLALMSGQCKTFKVAGRTFACKTVAYAHGDKGRVNFAVAVDDPADDSHVVSFSGENGKRADDNSYELRIDRMLLNSKHRPKVDGLPVPAEQTSTGLCRQTGNFAARKVNDVTCSATDSEGRRYELLFVSDGTPVSVRRIRQSSPSIQDPFK